MFAPKTTKQSIEIHVKHPREIQAQNLWWRALDGNLPRPSGWTYTSFFGGWVFVVGWSFVVKSWWFLSIFFWFDFVSLRFVYQVVNVFLRLNEERLWRGSDGSVKTGSCLSGWIWWRYLHHIVIDFKASTVRKRSAQTIMLQQTLL